MSRLVVEDDVADSTIIPGGGGGAGVGLDASRGSARTAFAGREHNGSTINPETRRPRFRRRWSVPPSYAVRGSGSERAESERRRRSPNARNIDSTRSNDSNDGNRRSRPRRRRRQQQWSRLAASL